MKKPFWWAPLHLLLIVALLLPQVARAQSPVATPVAGAPAVGASYTVGSCAAIESDQLRAEIEAAATAAMSSAEAVDIDALVGRLWAELAVDDAIDRAVADASARVAADESYWSRLLSGWSAQRAEEFAERVAADAFTSETFNGKIDELSLAIGGEIARAVNARLAGAASAAFLCLRDYVGQAYTETLFAVFEDSVLQSVTEANVNVDAGQLGINALDTHAMGLVGAGLVVAVEVGRRVSVKLSEKVAQRVAGKVVGRVAGRAGASIVPAIGWIVGVGLIVYDLVEGGQGALPQIEQALTSVEVKDRIRADVVDAVRVGIPEETSIAALETAVTMIERWDAFCTDYADVCALAQEDPSFAHLLNDAAVQDVARLESYVDLFLAEFGRERLENAIATGALDQLLALPQVSQQILRETGSVESTLAWAALAGDARLHDVAALGIHTLVAPSQLDAATLEKLTTTADAGLVQRLLSLDAVTMRALLALPPALVRTLVYSFSPDEVVAFVRVQQLPAITATPPALLAQAVISGLVTLEELATTPTPAPGEDALVVAQATPAPPTAAGNPAPAGTSAPAAGEVTGGAAVEANAAPAGNSWTVALLSGLVLLLTVAVALLFFRRRPPA